MGRGCLDCRRKMLPFLGAAQPAAEDLIARAIGIAGLVLAVAGIGLTAYLWWRSGPQLKVTAFVKAETGTVHIDVSSTGRITATVRRIELRDRFVLDSSVGQTQPTSRWAITGYPNGEPLPRDLAPSAFLDCDIDVKEVLRRADGAPEVSVEAWVQRGDGRWFRSRSFRVR
jgi:hypothetical protein